MNILCVAILWITSSNSLKCYPSEIWNKKISTGSVGKLSLTPFQVATTFLSSLIVNFQLQPVYGVDHPIESSIQDVLIEKLTSLKKINVEALVAPSASANFPTNFFSPTLRGFGTSDLQPEAISVFIKSELTDVRYIPALAGLVLFIDKVKHTRQLKDLAEAQRTEIGLLKKELLGKDELHNQTYTVFQGQISSLSAELVGKRKEIRELNETITSLIVNISSNAVAVEEGLVTNALRAQNEALQSSNFQLNHQLSLASAAHKAELDRSSKMLVELNALRARLENIEKQKLDNTKVVPAGVRETNKTVDAKNLRYAGATRVAMLKPADLLSGGLRYLKAYQLRKLSKSDLLVTALTLKQRQGGTLSALQLKALGKEELIEHLIKSKAD